MKRQRAEEISQKFECVKCSGNRQGGLKSYSIYIYFGRVIKLCASPSSTQTALQPAHTSLPTPYEYQLQFLDQGNKSILHMSLKCPAF